MCRLQHHPCACMSSWLSAKYPTYQGSRGRITLVTLPYCLHAISVRLPPCTVRLRPGNGAQATRASTVSSILITCQCLCPIART